MNQVPLTGRFTLPWLGPIAEQIQSSIPTYADQEQAAIAMIAIGDFLSGEFIGWMANGLGRFEPGTSGWWALKANLDDERSQDHPGLLLAQVTVARDIVAADDPRLIHRQGLAADVKLAFNAFVDSDDGLPIVTALTILECTSDVVVAHIGATCAALGGTDRRWSDIHGPADAEHAGALQDAYRQYVEDNLLFDKRLELQQRLVAQVVTGMWSVLLAA